MWVSAATGITLSSLTPQSQAAFNQATNQLATSGYNYDNAGNVTTEPGSRSYVYDAENHQLNFTQNSATTTYSYDGEGRRVKKVNPNNSTIVYVYNVAGQLIAEYDSSQAISNQPYQTSYLTQDHLGSTRVVTKADGTVRARYDFLPFGEEIAASIGGRSGAGYVTDSTRQKFTGHERDSESGLDFAQARYCSSATGRFMSADSVMGSMSNPQSLNLYIYVLNNPLYYTDPTGHLPFPPLVIADIKSRLRGAAKGAKTGAVIGAVTGAVVGGAVGAVQGATVGGAAGAVGGTLALPGGGTLAGAGGGAVVGGATGGTIGAGQGAIVGAAVGTIIGAITGFITGDDEDVDATPTTVDAAPTQPKNDPPKEITLFRGLNSTAPSAFRVDPDGVSTFEVPSTTHKANLPIRAIYQGEKVPGTIATLPDIKGGIAVYTPEHGGPLHWSLRFAGKSEQQIKDTLSQVAKNVVKLK